MNGCRCYCCRDELHDRPWTALIYLLVILGFVFLAQGCGNGISREPFQDAAVDAEALSQRLGPLPQPVADSPVDASLEGPPVDAMPDQHPTCTAAGLKCPPICTCEPYCSPMLAECAVSGCAVRC